MVFPLLLNRLFNPKRDVQRWYGADYARSSLAAPAQAQSNSSGMMSSGSLQQPKASSSGTPDKALDSFFAAVTPDVYARNPFRQLGSDVLASSRAIARHADELKLGLELNAAPPAWAFAPVGLTAEQVRTAAQALREPKSRLLHEFFWFWPDTYPEPSADGALAALASGDIPGAVQLWETAAAAGSFSAGHNLAVYYHLLAIDHARDVNAPAEAGVELWGKAIAQWRETALSEEFWEGITRRIARLADPQLPKSVVPALRTGLLPALARVSAMLATEAAETNRSDRVVEHMRLAGEFCGDDERAVRAVRNETTEPIERRVETRLSELRARVQREPAAVLPDAEALVRAIDLDMVVVSRLSGADSEAVRELARSCCNALLEVAIAYQRATSDDRGGLPFLVYLHGLDWAPELTSRIDHAFNVMAGNILTGQHQDVDKATAVAPPAAAEQLERLYTLMVESVMPALAKLELSEASQTRCAERIADVLQSVAQQAYPEHRDPSLALRSVEAVLLLTRDPARRTALEPQRAQLTRIVESARGAVLRLEGEGFVLELGPRYFRFNDEWCELNEITALRHGLDPTVSADSADRKWVIAWRSSKVEVELNVTNVFADSARAETDYDRIVAALYHLLAPRLVEKLVHGIQFGRDVELGASRLTAEGMVFGHDQRKASPVVPYRRIQHRFEGSQWIATSVDNPALTEACELARIWNAVLIGYVIDRLAQE